MGLPIWKPKDEHHQLQHQSLLLQQQHQKQKLASSKHQHASPPHFQAHYRLYQRRRSTTLRSSNPYYLVDDHHHHHHRTLHPLATHHDPSSPLPRSHAADVNDTPDHDPLMTQRLNEKQELLDQLNITTSLLDQFLSIRDMSGQENTTLPPFIADDLMAILTATSATLSSTSIPPSSNNNSSYDRSPTSNNALSPSMTENVTTSRLADLESSIVLAHHRVSDRLNLLGATSPPLITTTS